MSEIRLEDYAPLVGEGELHDLRLLAAPLKGLRVQHINSTALGGGVAEILMRLVPLMRELGLDASWTVLDGTPEFFEVTKAFHKRAARATHPDHAAHAAMLQASPGK